MNDVTEPFESFILIPGLAQIPDGPTELVDDRALIEGANCKRGHFNDPRVQYCQLCGIAMIQQTLVTVVGRRPSLGVLLFDTGATYRADADYILGRDPAQAPEVVAGEARPLKVTDPTGEISRRHLRISLSGWQVRVVDLGSANGTTVTRPGAGPVLVTPGEPELLVPGTRVQAGERWLRYESHRRGS
ncbi:FHA domain-containing protein [Longispora albida]|uniref:FHA domain-containing protein n=1 Tax=Longispora albida TaxID=203523 RepID=UPI0003650DB5|nr:FHA domain-containing protein [Longispora albida]